MKLFCITHNPNHLKTDHIYFKRIGEGKNPERFYSVLQYLPNRKDEHLLSASEGLPVTLICWIHNSDPFLCKDIADPP
jgi:hypothetical protein